MLGTIGLLDSGGRKVGVESMRLGIKSNQLCCCVVAGSGVGIGCVV